MKLRVPAAGLAATLLLLGGCAGIVPQPPADAPPVGPVAVTGASVPPVLRYDGLLSGKAEAALVASGVTLGSCLASLALVGCAGPYCPLMVAVIGPACVLSGTLAAAGSALRAESAESLRAAQAKLATPLQPQALQATWHAAVVDAVTRLPHPLAEAAAAEATLETDLEAIALVGGNFREPATLVIEARVRLRRADGRSAPGTLPLRWEGPARPLADWAAAPLATQQALATGVTALATLAAETALQGIALPDRASHLHLPFAPAFGLMALDPPTRVPLADLPGVGARLEWSEASSRTPTLRWQAFPRAGDRAAAPELVARMRDVRYDVVVARERHGAPDAIVFERRGIAAAELRIEPPLAPATRYFWSVRPRFVLDGRERVGEWSRLGDAPAAATSAPTQMSFRFRTPP